MGNAHGRAHTGARIIFLPSILREVLWTPRRVTIIMKLELLGKSSVYIWRTATCVIS